MHTSCAKLELSFYLTIAISYFYLIYNYWQCSEIHIIPLVKNQGPYSES